MGKITCILPQAPLVQQLLKPAKQVPDAIYRPLSFLVSVPVEDGLLWFNVLTKELVLLENDNWTEDLELAQYLKDHLFLVPQEYDEHKTWLQLRTFIRMFQRNQWDGKLSSYTILTTTDCNARCFYCFEKGCATQTMDPVKAREVSAYILKTCSKKKISLKWFGGEPLYNSEAIDSICQTLKDAGQPYSSGMTTNGYLFDEAMVQKAVDHWNLKSVQITLDGTEEIYNKRKAYIYKGVNAFQRVIRNIGLLLDAGIHVTIRLNMDMHNAQDLRQLVQLLAEKYAGKEGFSVYSHLLFQYEDRMDNHTETELGNQWLDFESHLETLKLKRSRGLNRTLKLNHCMADSEKSILISPDGELHLCEHFNDKQISHVGNIYQEGLDQDMIQKWKSTLQEEPACKTCVHFPDCVKLTCCPSSTNGCLPHTREEHVKNYSVAVLKAWENYKNKLSAEEEEGEEDC